MADDTTTTTDGPTGSADDIDILKRPSRQTGIDALSKFQSDSYNASLQGQRLQRQHRTSLAALGTITLPNDVSTQNIPAAAGAYSQADMQVIVNELAALRQIVAQQSVIHAFTKQTLTDNITKLT